MGWLHCARAQVSTQFLYLCGWRFSGWRLAVGGLRAVFVWRSAGGLRLAVYCGRFAGVLQAFCRRFAGGLRVVCGRFAGGLRATCVWRFEGGLRLRIRRLRAVCGQFAAGLWAVCGQFAGGLRLVVVCRRFAGGLRASGWLFCRRFAGVLRAVCGRAVVCFAVGGLAVGGLAVGGLAVGVQRLAVCGRSAFGGLRAVCVWRFAGGLRLAV